MTHRIALHVPDALHALRRGLRADGGDLRIVGGAIRDAARGTTSNDLDLLFHDPSPETMPERVERAGIDARMPFPEGFLLRGEIGDLSFDLFRLGAFRTPQPGVSPWETDLASRDLTMNAMSASLEGEVHDPRGGWDHAVAGEVVWNGPCAPLIDADPVRILRWIRFCLAYGRPLDPVDILDGFYGEDIESVSARLLRTSPGRIATELERILLVDAGPRAMAALDAFRIHRTLRLEPVARDPEDDDHPVTTVYGFGPRFLIYHLSRVTMGLEPLRPDADLDDIRASLRDFGT